MSIGLRAVMDAHEHPPTCHHASVCAADRLAALKRLFGQGLRLLRLLQLAGIVHNDILLINMLVRRSDQPDFQLAVRCIQKDWVTKCDKKGGEGLCGGGQEADEALLRSPQRESAAGVADCTERRCLTSVKPWCWTGTALTQAAVMHRMARQRCWMTSCHV
jgi:hypothetical protein